MLADSVTELFAARSMLYETARAIDRDPSDTRTAHAQRSMAIARQLTNRGVRALA